ncbi:hypothetical protein Leryth_004644 [Lithospermum erythrorhizon]|nr:hypothetical protein Leryth_004644 [Lithospermum erythrorhizon]
MISSLYQHISTMGLLGRCHKQQTMWPSRLSILIDVVLNERELDIYESASALSLTTFSSLLIEFVASRLQENRRCFTVLSEKPSSRSLSCGLMIGVAWFKISFRI